MSINLSSYSNTISLIQQVFNYPLSRQQKRTFVIAALALALIGCSLIAFKHYWYNVRHLNGQGEITKEDKVFKGIFKDGKLEKGTITLNSDGKKFEGTFEDDLLEGPGKVIAADGTVMVDGTFKKGKLIGNAKIVFENGDELEGVFNDGLPDGPGKFLKKADGSTFDGGYKDGKRDGKGKLTAKDGTVKDLEYQAGKLKTAETVAPTTEKTTNEPKKSDQKDEAAEA